jgi:hypothetical protein
MGTPDPGPDPDADAAGSPDPNPKASDTAQQSRQSSVDVGAVEDVVGMDEDTPALTPRASALAPPASAAQATVMAAVTATATVTPAATATAAATPAPAPRVHPATAALGSIARLIRELVRNREEKVAIARGAYDTVSVSAFLHRHPHSLTSRSTDTSAHWIQRSTGRKPASHPSRMPHPRRTITRIRSGRARARFRRLPGLSSRLILRLTREYYWSCFHAGIEPDD